MPVKSFLQFVSSGDFATEVPLYDDASCMNEFLRILHQVREASSLGACDPSFTIRAYRVWIEGDIF